MKPPLVKNTPANGYPYAQVTFSPQIRYSEALQNSIRQEKIMQQVMAMENIEAVWDSVVVEEKMLGLLGV